MKRILYWSDEWRPGDLAGIAGRLRPQDVIDRAVEILRAGEVIESWRGWANCRICDEVLGSRCLGAYGFQWPEKAEHYILRHAVWVPGLDELLEAAAREWTDEEVASLKAKVKKLGTEGALRRGLERVDRIRARDEEGA